MFIRDILNLKGSTIFSIGPTSRVSDAVKLMVDKDIGSLVVMEGGRMAGMLTFHDVAKAVIRETSFENRLLKRYLKNRPDEESARNLPGPGPTNS